MEKQTKVLDPVALKAMAHPLRMRLYDMLARGGPATATSLARKLGETSGATSYHLRQLHRAGLIEEDEERGTGRERWWRSAQQAIAVRSFDLPDEPSTQAAVMWFAREVQRRRNAWVERWYDTHRHWPQEWQEASIDSGWEFRMTPEQMAAMRDEVMALIERYRPPRDEEPAEGESVAVLFYAFPQPDDER